jgi:lysophospholipase L1-like esterase
MPVLITGDSHLARARPRHAEIAADTTSRAIGGSVATDLAGQVANLSPAAYDVVVVSIGTNDAGWRDVPLPTFLGAISSFLDWAGATPVVLMTSPGCDEGRAGGHWSHTRLRQYAEEAAALVTAAGGSVLDTPAVLAPLGAAAFVEDGFHLTPSAYDLLLPALAHAVS